MYRVCGRGLGDRINRGDRLRFDGVKVSVDAQRRRWFAVQETPVVESDDPPNYPYVDDRLESLTLEAALPPR